VISVFYDFKGFNMDFWMNFESVLRYTKDIFLEVD